MFGFSNGMQTWVALLLVLLTSSDADDASVLGLEQLAPPHQFEARPRPLPVRFLIPV